MNSIRETIISEIKNQESNYEPLFNACNQYKIAFIGQAPGKGAHQKNITAWNDASGKRLIEWLNLTEEDFYNKKLVALVPMDFYYPGKGKYGDYLLEVISHPYGIKKFLTRCLT